MPSPNARIPVKGVLLSRGLEDPKHADGSANVTEAAAIGGYMLMVEVADTEEMAKLVMPLCKILRQRRHFRSGVRIVFVP